MSSDLSICSSLIKSHFQLPDDELILLEDHFDELEKRLASIINNLLNNDMVRLMNAFYKIDLDERIFKEIITKSAPDQIATELAKEVIKREMKKVETRKKYSS